MTIWPDYLLNGDPMPNIGPTEIFLLLPIVVIAVLVWLGFRQHDNDRRKRAERERDAA